MIGELRDYFAMSALQGILSSESAVEAVSVACGDDPMLFTKRAAELAFDFADEMIAARVVKRND